MSSQHKFSSQKSAGRFWVYPAARLKSLQRFKLAGSRNFIKIITLIFVFTVPEAGRPASGGKCLAGQAKTMRVAIIQDAQSLDLYIKGFYKIIDLNADKVLSSGKYFIGQVKAFKGGISIGSINYPGQKLLIAADDAQVIKINGHNYRGNIELMKKENSNLIAVNFIELEDYIKGILFHEVSHYWPQEALKAQAVACRTYVLYQKTKNAAKDYDVTSDIYSQVYGGKSSERYRTNKAVDETNAEVLKYRDQLFPAYFHSTCAGHTEDAYLLWGVDIAPLKGVSCNYCRESEHYKWRQSLSLSSLKASLAKAGFKDCADILNITVAGRDLSGRINDLIIKTANKDIKVDCKGLRDILGTGVIKSTNFTLTIDDNNVLFEGLGWGHGAGMCQWGAYFMAKQGSDYKTILQYYYPGSEVTNY